MSRPRLAGLALVVLAAACGGNAAPVAATSSPGATVTAATDGPTLTIVASDTLAFDRDELVAVAGLVSIEMGCGPAIPHDLVIEDVGGELPVVSCEGGSSAVGSVELAPGTYTFYCSIQGHRATMEGTLTVT